MLCYALDAFVIFISCNIKTIVLLFKYNHSSINNSGNSICTKDLLWMCYAKILFEKFCKFAEKRDFGTAVYEFVNI